MLFDDKWIENAKVVNPPVINDPTIISMEFKIAKVSLSGEPERPMLITKLWFSNTKDRTFPDDIVYFPDVKLNGSEKRQMFHLECEHQNCKEVYVIEMKTIDHHNGQYELYHRYSSVEII